MDSDVHQNVPGFNVHIICILQYVFDHIRILETDSFSSLIFPNVKHSYNQGYN